MPQPAGTSTVTAHARAFPRGLREPFPFWNQWHATEAVPALVEYVRKRGATPA